MLEAKGIITWLPLAPVRRQWGRILKEIHTPVIPRCVFVYISNEERNTFAKILPTSSTGSYTSRTAGPMQSEQVDICQRAHTNHYPQQGALYQGLDATAFSTSRRQRGTIRQSDSQRLASQELIPSPIMAPVR